MGDQKKASSFIKPSQKVSLKPAPIKTPVSSKHSASSSDVPEQMIRKLSELLKSTDLAEIELSLDKVKIRVRAKEASGGAQTIMVSSPSDRGVHSSASLSAGASQSAKKLAADAASQSDLHIIRSPFVGTFYRSPSSSSPSYVEVGQVVNKGQALCIVEAMKLMNEIEADASGVIEKIFAENSTPVDFNAPLFGIRK